MSCFASIISEHEFTECCKHVSFTDIWAKSDADYGQNDDPQKENCHAQSGFAARFGAGTTASKILQAVTTALIGVKGIYIRLVKVINPFIYLSVAFFPGQTLLSLFWF